jgi:hypothetical protein
LKIRISIILLALLLVPAIPSFGQAAPHSVKLTIIDATNPTGTTYNIYKASAACSTNPTMTLLTPAPISSQTFTDANVPPGTYCYAATAVGTGGESAKSPTASAGIPPNGVTITIIVL